MQKQVSECAQLIKNSKNTIVLTGAGMSTESGIPDFRSDKGIYKKVPEIVLSYGYFLSNPVDFYEFINEYFTISDVEPNEGHKVLADWEDRGLVSHIITQNIEGLHQKAGSKNVLEVHGTIETATCINSKCQGKYNVSDVLKNNQIFCPKCGSLVKPDVVLYDESVDKISDAVNLIRRAELLIILGSSMTVYPVASLPLYLNQDSHIIIINNSPTQYDNRPNTTSIHNPIGETLRAINDII